MNRSFKIYTFIPEEKYYIKRLVGLSGDTLEVKEPVLYRNGEPISGSLAFDKNFHKDGEYTGYTASGSLAPGLKEYIPENYYLAMGDNSKGSYDSRFWGGVPEKAVLGKAVFIIYPFSGRWGIAE